MLRTTQLRLPLAALGALVTFACAGSRPASLPAQAPAASAPARAATALQAPLQFPTTEELDASITAPAMLLGQPLGERLAAHAEVVELWRRWAAESERVALREYGRTLEGRELLVGIVTSPANHARLDAIVVNQRRLADPRGLPDDERDALCRSTPAVAYLGCSIHGDETSGVDGGLALAHGLIAGRGERVEALLDDLVIVVDPCMNPDGRERFRAMVVQNSGRVPSLDAQSVSRGRWPRGRGNHYLFDMNRDWMAGVTPETRGRWSVLSGLLPQLFVDAHEMGAHDTFLFYPQAAPHNPRLPARLAHWQQVFGAAQAAAFDAHGWSYYTREWADAWGPFYSDAWGSLHGAVGMLYEQASFGGQSLLRGSGEVVGYREAVEHQAAAFLASLDTLREHREQVLRDFAAHRAASLGERAACVIRPTASDERTEWLAGRLRAQGAEVWRATSELERGAARGALGERV
ncbi:MAG TPA: M14 family zinc carboxypeptidase, partial [Planctomycetota bacterium]|nr:M14 family zinc carboxypeptidase [Planctomycetota bacterium]